MRSTLRTLSVLLAAVFSVVGCGTDSALIIVDIKERPAAVQTLRLMVKLNDKQIASSIQVTSSLDNFGLLLPPEPSGQFLLTADGLDSHGCVIAQGHTDTTLMGQDRVRLSLTMTALRLAICQM